MKKKILALGLASLMAVSLAGCGGTDTASNNSATKEAEGAKSVTINVTTTYAGEDTNAGNYKDAVKAWEESSGNKVNDSSATSDETFKTRVLTDFEAGSEPDVLFYFNGVDSNAFVEQGKVVSIDDIRAEYPEYADNMKDSLMGASPVDGKNYSVPVNGYWEGLFYNKEVLDKAGVKAPDATTTYDEFLDICKKIKDAGFTPIAASLGEIPHYWFEYAIFNNHSLADHGTVPKSADDEIGKAWVAGMDDIKALYDLGYFPENTLTAKDDETFQLFTSDKAAFLCDGSWKLGGIQSAVEDPDNFGVTHVPAKGDRATTEAIGGISMGYFITTKAWEDPEKRDAVVSFVEYMTSDEVVSKFAGLSATALKNGVTVDDSEFDELEKSAVKFTSEITGLAPAVQDSVSTAAREPLFVPGMADIVKGSVASKDAVAECIKIMEEEAE